MDLTVLSSSASGLAALGVIALILAVWVSVLHWRLHRALAHYRRLAQGSDGETLSEMLEAQMKLLQQNAQRLDAAGGQLEELHALYQRSLQRVGLVRFNPFGDTGGDQSFSIALLDNVGDGVVISSLYGRAQHRLYAKPVQGGHSKYALSTEEEQAIALATMHQ